MPTSFPGIPPRELVPFKESRFRGHSELLSFRAHLSSSHEREVEKIYWHMRAHLLIDPETGYDLKINTRGIKSTRILRALHVILG